MMKRTFDVAVIGGFTNLVTNQAGGGIAGASAAHLFSIRGANVILLEAGKRGSGARCFLCSISILLDLV
jgi:glycerol-3-phosphate dehydrogenase